MAVIKAKLNHFRMDYTNEILPPLFKKQDSDCDFSSDLLQIDSNRIKVEIDKATLTLLVAVDQLKNQHLIRALQTTADKGVRIYLLLGDTNFNQPAIDALSGRCLVRAGTRQSGCLILRDHTTSNANGLLIMNQLVLAETENQSWAMKLESQQIEDSYRSFCKLFWECSQYEYLIQNKLINATKHPDGSIVTNHSHHLSGCLRECLNDTFSNIQKVSKSNHDISENKHLLLLNTNSSNIHARHGVALTDSSIPSLLFSNQGDWLLPDSVDFTAANWCLRLSDRQSMDLHNSYENAFENAAWQYTPQVKLIEFSNKQLVRFADQPELIQQVEQQRKVKLKPIFTNDIDSFLGDEAKHLAQPQIGFDKNILAHHIDFEVIVHPPYCPANAKEDELYGNWKKAELDWQKKLCELENKQLLINEKQNSIADQLKAFINGFLLGQSQSIKKLNQELSELKLWSPIYASPSERQQQSQKLINLAKKINDRSQRTATEIDKAEQNNQWEVKQLQLRKQCDNAKSVVTSKKEDHELVTSNKMQYQSEALKTFYSRWKEAVESLSAGQLRKLKVDNIHLEQFHPKEVPEDKEKQQTVKQQITLNFAEVIRSALHVMNPEEAVKLRNLTTDKTFRNNYKAMNTALDNYQQALAKIERDIDSANKNVDKANSELAGAELALENHGSRFEYKAPNNDRAFEQQLGLEAHGDIEYQFNWPNEDLPNTSLQLKVDKNKRWLVIDNTEQLAQARKDAERLTAIICVKNVIDSEVDYA